MSIENKVAIVCGGARDIGRAVSERLAADGAKVVVNYSTSREAGEDVVESIKAKGGEALAVGGDMTNSGNVEKLVKETRKAFGDSI